MRRVVRRFVQVVPLSETKLIATPFYRTRARYLTHAVSFASRDKKKKKNEYKSKTRILPGFMTNSTIRIVGRVR